MQHNEPAGNQDVWHYHLHLFPRYANDGLYSSRRELMAAAERAEYAQKLRAKLEDGQSSSTDGFGKAYDQLKSDVHQRLQVGDFDEQLVGMARHAMKGALSVEGVIVSRTVQNHLLRDILKDTLDEALKKL